MGDTPNQVEVSEWIGAASGSMSLCGGPRPFECQYFWFADLRRFREQLLRFREKRFGNRSGQVRLTPRFVGKGVKYSVFSGAILIAYQAVVPASLSARGCAD